MYQHKYGKIFQALIELGWIFLCLVRTTNSAIRNVAHSILKGATFEIGVVPEVIAFTFTLQTSLGLNLSDAIPF